MASWQQQYPGQGAPPPAGFQVPNQQGFYPQGGYVQPGYSTYPTAPPATTFLPHQPPMDGYESGNFGGSDFTDQAVRKGFIRKVYSILMVQLLITMGFIAIFVFNQDTRRFAQENSYLYIVGMVALLIVIIVLACCGEVRRKFPINIILLAVYTVVQGFMLGIVTARFRADEVMYSIGITAAVCLALTLFAFQTKWDFTMMGGILVACSMVFLLFGIIAMFFQGQTIRLVYASIGALLFSVYFVYDTQMMLGGKHKYSISPEEYVFAALNLYADVVAIFLMILQIFGSSRD